MSVVVLDFWGLGDFYSWRRGVCNPFFFSDFLNRFLDLHTNEYNPLTHRFDGEKLKVPESKTQMERQYARIEAQEPGAPKGKRTLKLAREKNQTDLIPMEELTLESFVNDGYRVGLVKERFAAFCFTEQFSHVSDVQEIVKRLKYDASDAYGRQPAEDKHKYAILSRKIRVVKGIQLRRATLDVLEKLACAKTLKADMGRWLDVSTGGNPPAPSCLNIDCCLSYDIDRDTDPLSIPGCKGEYFDDFFLQQVRKTWAVYKPPHESGTDDKQARINKCWMDVKLALFLGICCDREEGKDAPTSTGASQPANHSKTPGTKEEYERNQHERTVAFETRLPDFIEALLLFEDIMHSSSYCDMGVKDVNDLYKKANSTRDADGRETTPEAIKRHPLNVQICETTFNADRVGSTDNLSDGFISRLLALHLDVSKDETQVRRAIRHLRSATTNEIDDAAVSWSQVQLCLVDVAMQFTVLITIPTIFVLVMAAIMQHSYATTIGAGSHPLSIEEMFFGEESMLTEPGWFPLIVARPLVGGLASFLTRPPSAL